MGITSLQVCMDTSEWLQGMTNEEGRIDSSSSPSGDIITCARPLMERRLKPPHDQSLKCPRCDSTHTKFCYYNNYSLSQPRYFCKTCRRYWTKGGSLRNIPVGGGCRKNKKVSVNKKSSTDNNQPHNQHSTTSSYSHDTTDLHLSSFPELHLSHLTSLLGHSSGNLGNPLFMENKYNSLLENPPRPTVDFMESKFDAILGNPRNHDFMGSSQMGLLGGLGDVGHHGFSPSNLHGLCSSYGNGICLDGNNATVVDTCQRLMLPFEGNHEDPNAVDMKPNKQLLSLDWQEQGCSEVGRDSFGYLNSLGSWSGVMNGYGSSAANPLV